MKWFDNPRKRHRKRKRKAPKGGWKRYMAKLRAMKKGGRRRKRRSVHTGGTMARRKRRSSKRRNAPRRRSHRRARSRAVTVRVNPRRVRRYRRRHNPRFSVKGIMARVQQGAIDGLWIVGGKAVTNALPSLVGLQPTGALGIGVKALAAVGAGYLFGMVSANAGKLATAAGFASIYEPFIKGLNLPIISPALADEGAYPDVLSAYPDELSAYPSGVGDDSDYAMQY
jgi:hypothetical protein